jgi:hypothetical protein
MSINWTTVTAIVGAALGLWNFVQGFWQRRVRLKVVPMLTISVGGGFLSNSTDWFPNGSPCIEVTNLSAFPVTIAEVGFSLAGKKERFQLIPNPPSVLPKRLEPRESIDVRATQGVGFPKQARLSYATTQCKNTRYGDSIVLRKHRESQT